MMRMINLTRINGSKWKVIGISAVHRATFVLVPSLGSGRTNFPDSTFPCKSCTLWLHHSTSVTLLHFSWEISISYWPKIVSVVSFHLLSGRCWGSDLLWDLQSIAHKVWEGFAPKTWWLLQENILLLITWALQLELQHGCKA